MKIAIQMDHPAGLNPAGDSTIALALEAQRRNHALYYYHPTQLLFQNGELLAQQAQPVTFKDDANDWFELGEPTSVTLAEIDAVLMRQDPPFDMAYLSATYLLERLPDTTRVINNPAYVRNAPEKLAILDFPDFIPPTIVTSDEVAIETFRDTHQRIVIKPLYGFGGHSIYVFDQQDANLLTFLEQHKQTSAEPLMVQAFLPEVADKDVRVLVIDGKVSAAIGRLPAAGSIRSNMRVGGTPIKVALNERQQTICDTVGKKLKNNGVLFAGIDLIGDYLTEINITSPTGIRAAHQLYDKDPSVDFWDAVESF